MFFSHNLNLPLISSCLERFVGLCIGAYISLCCHVSRLWELEFQVAVNHLRWFWEPNPDALEEQQAFLTTEPSLLPQNTGVFLKHREMNLEERGSGFSDVWRELRALRHSAEHEVSAESANWRISVCMFIVFCINITTQGEDVRNSLT